jgi:hypothetical protein
MRAKDLILTAAKGAFAACPPKLKAELAEVLAHNDTAPQGRRVTYTQVQALCASHGVTIGRLAFIAMLRREFGRGWSQ